MTMRHGWRSGTLFSAFDAFYLDLAQAVLGVRFLGGGGLAPARVPRDGVRHGGAADVPLEQDHRRVGVPEMYDRPEGYELLDAEHAPQLDDEYHVAYVGTRPTNDLSQFPSIQQFGSMLEGRVGIYEDLEGRTRHDRAGSYRVRCRNRSPRPSALGTRYLS